MSENLQNLRPALVIPEACLPQFAALDVSIAGDGARLTNIVPACPEEIAQIQGERLLADWQLKIRERDLSDGVFDDFCDALGACATNQPDQLPVWDNIRCQASEFLMWYGQSHDAARLFVDVEITKETLFTFLNNTQIEYERTWQAAFFDQCVELMEPKKRPIFLRMALDYGIGTDPDLSILNTIEAYLRENAPEVMKPKRMLVEDPEHANWAETDRLLAEGDAWGDTPRHWRQYIARDRALWHLKLQETKDFSDLAIDVINTLAEAQTRFGKLPLWDELRADLVAEMATYDSPHHPNLPSIELACRLISDPVVQIELEAFVRDIGCPNLAKKIQSYFDESNQRRGRLTEGIQYYTTDKPHRKAV